MKCVVDSKNPFLAEALRHYAVVEELPTAEITREALRDADAVVVRSETRVNAALLDRTAVKFVGTATIGTDHVDMEYVAGRGIGFASAPGSNADSVAEYIAAALLEVAGRRGISLAGTTLGVVGVGNVGSRVVRVGRALGMRVLQNDPPRARATGDPTFAPLDALMDADFLSLHVPLTRTGEDPTFHLFNDRRLSGMKSGSYLINTSRGGVVDTAALRRVLAGGLLAGAVLDVWEGEPVIDTELLALVDVGTPHIAGYSFDGKVNAARMMFEAVTRYFDLQARWMQSDALPPPKAVQMSLPRDGSMQGILRHVITACYAIAEDDQRLRVLLQLLPDARGTEFRRQRSSYPVRREFHATTIHVTDDSLPECASLHLLGFRLQNTPSI
jgi:erythronate-4-phosphate dehydrogenase